MGGKMFNDKRKIKIIDLSVSLKNDRFDREPEQITYSSHAQGAKGAAQRYSMKESDFPDSLYAASESVKLNTHSGTHLDSPWHYGPTSEGKPSKTIDQIPLEWCYSDGVVLDFSYKKKGESITVADLEANLKKINYKIKPFDIVLIRTDTDKHYYEPGYDKMHPGMSKEATLWLIERGVKVTGIDAWGWDRPTDVMVAEFKSGIKDRFWASHLLGRSREYCHLERLANLDQIPKPFGFKVAVFPIKIEKASAGWVRAVAIFEEK
jgi:kynurenine formamidase